MTEPSPELAVTPASLSADSADSAVEPTRAVDEQSVGGPFDETLAQLSDIHAIGLSEAASRFEEVHGVLQSALADLDRK